MLLASSLSSPADEKVVDASALAINEDARLFCAANRPGSSRGNPGCALQVAMACLSSAISSAKEPSAVSWSATALTNICSTSCCIFFILVSKRRKEKEDPQGVDDENMKT